MSAVNRDLQANHQIILSLEQSKTQSERIIDTLSGLFLVFDRNLTIWRANLGLASALSREFEDLTGSPLDALFGNQELEIFKAKLDHFLSSKDRSPIEFELSTRTLLQGKTVEHPFLWSLSTFELPGHASLDLFQATAKDITEIKQAAQVFASLPLGLLIMDPTGIQSRFSAYTEVLLGRSDLAGQKLSTILFPEGLAKLKPQEAAALEQLESIWGQDDLLFELARDQFPKIVHYSMPENSIPPQRHLGITLQSILSKGTVKGIIVLIDDKTDFVLAREREAAGRAAEERSIARIMQVKRVAPAVAQPVFRDLNTSVSALRPAITGRDLRTIRAAIHSIKGNSRIAGLEHLSHLCHETENYFAEALSIQAAPDWIRTEQFLEEILQEWSEIYGIYLALSKSAAPVKAPNTITQELIDRLTQAQSVYSGAEIEKYQIERLKLALTAQNLTPLDQLKPVLEHRLEKLSESLGVKASLDCDWNEVRTDAPSLSVLSECMVHLVNNSLAHGFGPQDNARSTETPSIRLMVSASQMDDTIECTFKDDGCGIQVEKVKAAALKLGLINLEKSLQMSRDEVIQLITHPGLSTSEKVDELSGRGVGMDAVHLLLEKAGGSLEVSSPPGKGACFTLSLPKPYTVQAQRKLVGFSQLLQAIGAAISVASSDVPGFTASDITPPASDWDRRGLAFADPRLLATSVATLLIYWSRGTPIEFKLEKVQSENLIVISGERKAVLSSAEEEKFNRSHPEFAAALHECWEILKQHGFSGKLPPMRENRIELRIQTLIEGNMIPCLKFNVETSEGESAAEKLQALAWSEAEQLGFRLDEAVNDFMLFSVSSNDNRESIRENLLKALEKRLFG